MDNESTPTEDIDKAPKLQLQELLELAKASVKDELIACGCSKNELVGLRLECKVSQLASPKSGKSYLIEWTQPLEKEPDESKEEAFKDKLKIPIVTNTISNEFIVKLFANLREEAIKLNASDVIEKSALKLSTRMSFRTGESINFSEDCDYNCPTINGLYQHSLYSVEGGNKRKIKKCIGTICDEQTSAPPIE